MTDRPILFSGPMVRALLAGRKTQTRRVIKLPTKSRRLPIYERPDLGGWEASTIGGPAVFSIGKNGERIPEPERACVWHRTTGTVVSPSFKVGDRLWVREAWRTESRAYDDLAPSDMSGEETVLFEADADWSANKTVGRARTGLHMPRWASRLTLVVTEVRVQRLQEISGIDAVAEGVRSRLPDNGVAQSEYFDLWNSLHGVGAYHLNPWVVAISFTVERRNIDQVLS